MAKEIKAVSRARVWQTLVAIVIITVLAVLIDVSSVPDYIPGSSFFNKFKPRLGLDLQGGTHLVYQADLNNISATEKSAAMEGVRDVIERRVNAFGVSEPVVQTNSNNRLMVELAGVKDVKEAIKQIGETPLLEFKEQGAEKAIKLDDKLIKENDKYNQDQLAKAKSLVSRLNKGEDFAKLATEFSADPGSKDKGGDLGFVKKGTFVPEFDKAIFEQLKNGQITQTPVKSQFGYHIIQKLEEKGSGADLEVKSRHILLATKDNTPQVNVGDQNWVNTKLGGKQLTKASVQFEPSSNQPVVSLEFNDEGKQLFAEITKRNIKKPVAIFLDGQAISIPTVQDEITGGKAIISGNFNTVEAKLLAQRLNAGALPVPITLVSQQTIGASLGETSLQQSVVAGIIGLFFVILFMLLYYRVPGLLASIALLIYSLIALAIFELWPVTLTLAGIAGFILSVGMAVDANILIFERTKEELRNGKPLSRAIEEGFARAWLSIRDSNASSLITCAILFWFGSSIIKGFAMTLAIGIIVSLFSAITITRTFLRLVASKFFNSHLWWFGLNTKIKQQ